MTAPERSLPIKGLPDFWAQVRQAPHRFLGLDYDGTLAPFNQNRFLAFPLPGIVDVLHLICQDQKTSLAIVSGRPIKETLQFIGNLAVTIVGSHGAEILTPDKTYQTFPPTPSQSEILSLAAQIATDRGYADLLERKIASLALHTRSLPTAQAQAIEQEIAQHWSALTSNGEIQCHHFKGGIELRVNVIEKGTALRNLLLTQPGDVFAVYLGDDQTDEDAFAEVKNWGVGIKVTTTTNPTLASGRLPDCPAVLNFLKDWRKITNE